MRNKSLFGPYNSVTDETMHCLLAFVPAYAAYVLDLPFLLCAVIFLSGSFLIDVDHLLNSSICRKVLKVPDYKGTLASCDKGYAPNIFHGLDVFALLGLLGTLLVNPAFGILLFISLSFHLAWDFAVYPHNPSLLLFATRAARRFRVGERDFFRGKVFDLDTLKY